MEHYFSGTVERVIFENASNFFKILLLEIEDTDSDFEEVEIIVTGTMADIVEGESYTFWGELTQHPRYGEQLTASRYERAKPSAAGLVKYFSSDQFKGIGKKTAENILATYGEVNTIDQILADPSQLASIPGLSKVKREAFLTTLKLNYGTEQILSKLAEYGLTTKIALQIFDKYKDRSLDVVVENPYQLVEDIQGIGFKTADQLAESLGIDSQSPQRFRAALIHSLLDTCLETGNTYVEAKELLGKAISLLEEARQVELDPSQVAAELGDLIAEDKVQNIDTKIFDNSLYFAEQGIHRHISRLLDNDLAFPVSDKEIHQEIAAVEDRFKIAYDQTQKAAIAKALKSKVFILTGGPGTGKTTVIKGILAAYGQLHDVDLEGNNPPVILAAPTGRAARRMNELTGLPAATIHRHLGLTGEGDYQALDDYLDADLIIVDEFSMVDTWLANQLFASISSNTQVILVGDSDQLPSVGPGQVLADLLEVEAIPKIALEKIFRQSEDSTIVTLANQLKQGQLPADFTQKKPDRSYFEAQSQHIPTMVKKIVSSAIASGINPHDVQILAPMYRGQAGITVLNQLLQELVNPKGERLEFVFNDTSYREGDKVLHLVNDPDSNVFNGDIGIITQLMGAKYTDSKQDELTIVFDGNEVTYPRKDWGKITLAYAMSIHKSQGSEFPVVILPLTRGASRMLQRNLIYTAITRSKSKLVMLGELAAFDLAVRTQGSQRATHLLERFGVKGRADQPEGSRPTNQDLATSSDQPRARLTEAVASQQTKETMSHQASPQPGPADQPEGSRPTNQNLATSSDQPRAGLTEAVASQQTKETMSHQASPQPGPADHQQATQPSQTRPVPPAPVSYRLTADNLHTIDPMIGLTEEDIRQFFKS